MKSNELSNNTWRKVSPPKPSLAELLARSKTKGGSESGQARNDAKTGVEFTPKSTEEHQRKAGKDGMVMTFLKRLFRTSSGEDGSTPVKNGKADIKHD